MGLLSFFLTRKGNSKNNVKAALVGAGAGLGTYYVTHETEWGQQNLGFLDGVTPPPEQLSGPGVTAPDGSTVHVSPIPAPTTTSSVVKTLADNTAGVLKSWGPTGTALVAGTVAGVATGNKWLLYGGLAIAAFLILK